MTTISNSRGQTGYYGNRTVRNRPYGLVDDRTSRLPGERIYRPQGQGIPRRSPFRDTETSY